MKPMLKAIACTTLLTLCGIVTGCSKDQTDLSANQFKVDGFVERVEASSRKVDDIQTKSVITLQPNQPIAGNPAMVTTNDTVFYTQKEGKRTIATMDALQANAKIELWAYFINDHTIAAKEVTVLEP